MYIIIWTTEEDPGYDFLIGTFAEIVEERFKQHAAGNLVVRFGKYDKRNEA